MKLALLAFLSMVLIGISSVQGEQGLNYKYYEGTWSLLPDFNSLSPVKSGISTTLNLDPRRRDKQYGFVYQGYITIPSTGKYTFETYSDDGSKLYIGDYNQNVVSLVNNDGLHGNQFRSGSVDLNAGVYPITLTYFQNDGGQTWEAYWSSNTGISRQKIPASVLSTTTTNNTNPSTGGSQGLNYNYYEGSWSSLPNFNALSPVKTGTATNVGLGNRNREQQYAFFFHGFITIPATGSYTFSTLSDDGSKLYIGNSGFNDVPLVNNDGLHGMQVRSGTISLNAGVYPIAMSFFQNSGGQAWEVYWSSNTGISQSKIPDNVFSTGSTGGTPPVEAPVAPEPNPEPTPEPEPNPELSPAPSAPTNPTSPSGSGGYSGANNYYFSSTNGDDSRSSSQARNPSTPWRTLNKLNSIIGTLQGGDAIRLNRGDVFDGSINFPVSGGTNNPIILSSYGDGNRPVINGLTTMSNWTHIGNGVWQANCQSSDRINMVTMNGAIQALGRYPNINSGNNGFLTMESHAGSYQVTDYQLSGSPNFTNAEIVVRKNGWVLDRGLITNHSGNTINYNSPTAHEPWDGYGFFIQNSDQTLDQLGEWYFDTNNRVLKMYFGSENPNSYDVKASTVNTLLTISNKSNFIIDNIAFVGGDNYGVKLEYAQNIRFQNCDINFSGTQAFSAQNTANVNFENNLVINTSNDAIDCNYVTNMVIKGNVVRNTGLIPGMGGSGNQQYNAILVEGTGNTIELNTVENTGYSGITFAGESLLVKNNYINNFCLTVEDGGGIYGWGDLYKQNRKLIGNIILNGIGNTKGTNYGTSTGASGIMHDDESANVEMSDNTIANCSRAGILIHNSHDMTLRNNTIFDSKIQLSMVHDVISVNHPIRNINLDNNILVSKKPNQFVLELSTIKNDIGNFGNFNNNYYERPIDDYGIIFANYRDNNGKVQSSFHDLNGWKTSYGNYDQQTRSSPIKVPAFKINGYNGGNRYGNSSFNNNVDNTFCLSSPGTCSVNWTNNGGLDGGALRVSYSTSGATNTVGTYIDLGSTTGGRQYLVKFSSSGAQSGKNLRMFMLDGSSYAQISEPRSFSLSNYRIEHEFIYTANVSAGRTLMALETYGPDGPYYLDNLQVYDVNASPTNPDDYIRLEYNASTSAKNIWLNGDYVDAKNNSYSGNVTLQPFTSLVLINKSANQIATQSSRSDVSSSATLQAAITDSKALTVNVSPNPATKNLHIVLNAPQGTQKTSLSIHTISGVEMKKVVVNNALQNLDVDVSTWSPGVYIINYVCDGKTIYKKFVKQ